MITMQWNEFVSHIRHLGPKDQQRIHDAFELGKRMHAGQKRRSGDPYFTHPIAVTLILARMGADADTLVASLLHDTVEDTDLTLRDIHKLFNGDVTALIDGVTKLNPEDVADSPSLDEQIETLRKIFISLEEDVRVMMIKLVDRLHNMQTIEHLSQERQKAMAQETLDVFVKIADRLSMQDMRNELEGLCIAILNPSEYKKLLALEERNRKKSEAAIDEICTGLQKDFSHLYKNTEVIYEVNSWKKLRSLLQSEGLTTGIASVSVVFACDTIDHCYGILGALHQMFPREALSFQDFLNAPMTNGYRGIHTTIILNNGLRVRCKIRTQEMNIYAHYGISTFCFDNKATGVTDYLIPWGQHISNLSRDTESRSDQFWESLKSDILGESIIVHNANGMQINVPYDATALDAAFYCYPSKALRTQSITLNGEHADFGSQLRNGVTIEIVTSKKKDVPRNWLDYVHTGVAIAAIRKELSSLSSAKKIVAGKELLENYMQNRKKGFLEEFDKTILMKKIKESGYKSLNNIFEELADGTMEPIEAYNILFGQFDKKPNDKDETSVIQYSLNAHQENSTIQTNALLRAQGNHIKDVRYHYDGKSQYSTVRALVSLSNMNRELFKRDLKTAGAQDIEIIPRSIGAYILTATVILLWALNPVFAKWLILEGMDPMALVTIRLLTFAVFTGIFYFGWSIVNGKKYSPIPQGTLLAVLPAFAIFLLSIFTYKALQTMPPSIHITFLRLNILLLPLLYIANKKGWTKLPYMILVCTLFVGFIYQYIADTTVLAAGVILSILSLAAYLFFSLSTERVLQQYKIDMRYPSFLFQIGVVLGLIGLFMIPFHSKEALLSPLTVTAILYVALCVWIPYTCYSAVLKKIRFKHITNIFLLEVPLTIVFEMLFLHIFLPTIDYILLAILAVLLLGIGRYLSRIRAT